jgi:hypothetical protein
MTKAESSFEFFFYSSGLASVKGELSLLTEDAVTWSMQLQSTIQQQPLRER